MTGPDPSELLAAAKQRVGGVRTMLQSPRSCRIDECLSLLREAQGYLEWLRDGLSGGAGQIPANWVTSMKALTLDIRQTGVLLEQAARFGRRWLERLESNLGYTAAGLHPAWQPRGHIFYLG
jgi:hypothetical protein